MQLFLRKIFNNLSQPLKIPIKLLNKFLNIYFFFRYSLNYNENYYANLQEEKFKKINLNRAEGLEKLNNIKSKYSFIESQMSSEHQAIMAAISVNKRLEIKKILEIGTFDGKNTFLLSQLFSEAEITTLDLEDDSSDFKKYYDRENLEKRKNFIFERNKILQMSKKIKFIQKNSVKLIFDQEKYDLIWIDGAHGYPVVTIDIINALRLINKNGIILCDDIYINKIKDVDEMYNSNASYETLKTLKSSGLLDYNLLFKRLDKKNNSVPSKRKYVGFIEQI
tara:strand:- start:306 stop:1142 length:837 start_codon:yes stop_codon:yes gene_type:complete